MPYDTDASVPSYVPAEHRAQWRAIFNKELKAQIDAGKSQEEAEAAAFRLASGVVNKQEHTELTDDTDTRVPAYMAVYAELPGAIKDADCHRVKVPGGVSSEKGCCDLWEPVPDPKNFSCQTCTRLSIINTRKENMSELDIHISGKIQAERLNALISGTAAPLADVTSGTVALSATAAAPAPAATVTARDDRNFIWTLSEMLPVNLGGKTLFEVPIAVTGSWVKNGRRFSITSEDLDDMIRNFEARGNGQVVVDYEHASEQPEVAKGGPVPAAGWFHKLQKKNLTVNGKCINALSALIEWTPKAAEMLQNGEYRFFSPAIDWTRQDKHTGNALGATLTSGALTNHPFLEELPPITLSDMVLTTGAQAVHVDSANTPVSIDFPQPVPSAVIAGDKDAKKMAKKAKKSLKLHKIETGPNAGLFGLYDDTGELMRAVKGKKLNDMFAAMNDQELDDAVADFDPDPDNDGDVDCPAPASDQDSNSATMKDVSPPPEAVAIKPADAVQMADTKSEEDGKHPSSHYLVVEDPAKPSTWHLRVKNASGKVDHGLMGDAWAALHSGWRGKKYEGPNKSEAISKLESLYKSEGMDTPGKEKNSDPAAPPQINKENTMSDATPAETKKPAAVLLTECVKEDGHLDVEKVVTLSAGGEVTGAEAAHAIAMKGAVDEAISKGNFLPSQRAVAMRWALRDEKDFQTFVATAKPQINLDTVGVGGDTPVSQTGSTSTAETEFLRLCDAKIASKRVQGDTKYGYEQATNDVSKENPKLYQEYRGATVNLSDRPEARRVTFGGR